MDRLVVAQDYTTIATLESFNGAQRYAILETVNVDDYSSVVIWCAQFNVTFGYAAL
ncbi:MAG: DM13 domain-containing protein [Cyanobacteria bacterium P01_A01_bin.123]